MQNGRIIIWDAQCFGVCPIGLHKLTVIPLFNVAFYDRDVSVTIGPRMLVVKPQSVTDFVSRNADLKRIKPTLQYYEYIQTFNLFNRRIESVANYF